MIADFGLVCPTISESDHTGETGTYRYMSAEVIRHEVIGEEEEEEGGTYPFPHPFTYPSIYPYTTALFNGC